MTKIINFLCSSKKEYLLKDSALFENKNYKWYKNFLLDVGMFQNYVWILILFEVFLGLVSLVSVGKFNN